MEKKDIKVGIEFTPNPNTLKFSVNQKLIERGAVAFNDIEKAKTSPLVSRLFGVRGVEGIMVGVQFVTVTKAPDGDWDHLADEIPKSIENHLMSGEPSVDAKLVEKSGSPSSAVEEKIRKILDDEIRPAVAMDGGDIEFRRYEDGIVYLHLQGSCSSCPSALMTLKMGVETRLKEVVPEIKEVVEI